MFSIKRVPIPPTRKNSKGKVPEPLTIHAISEAGNVIILASTGKVLVRWNIKELPEDIELPFKEDKMHKVFIDFTGNHVIITTVAGDCYYLHSSKSKVVNLKRFSDYHIESVAWNRVEGTESSTGPILLGTRNGMILESCIEGKEKYVKEVFSMQQNMPICSLQFERFPAVPTSPAKFFVMAATANPCRYFQFIGGPDFASLFAYYQELDRQNCTELPGDLNYTELRFFTKPGEPRASRFALLTGFATYYGSLYFGSQTAGEQLTADTRDTHHAVAPLSIALTEFHLLSLFPRKLTVRNILSDSVVYERESAVELRGMCPDPLTGFVWVFSDRELFVIEPHDEDRDAWKLFLQSARDGEPGDFEKALGLCKDDCAREEVRRAQADFYFRKRDFARAAELYAATQLSLEEIALQFLDAGERGALKVYLLRKLDQLPAGRRAQRMLLCTWLTEIYLDEISGMSIATEAEEEAKQSLLVEFRRFLTERGGNLDVNTTYALLSSHGCVEELLFFARLIEDYDRVLTHHIQREDIASAIFILQEVPVEKAEPLYYKFAPQMLLAAPRETVDAWMAAPFLAPCKLIPALVRYDQQRGEMAKNGAEALGENEAIRYLEYQVKEIQNTDPAIHNYLLSLYAVEEDTSDLMAFLDYFKEDYIYDVKYALRVCIQEGKHEACVYIYSLLHLYEEAVKLALRVNLDLAKDAATKAEESVQKKLWLIIARYLIEKCGDIEGAIALLEECPLLKIDDLLPWFPDFVIIDQFKDRIVESLETYNNQIDELKGEMEAYTSSAEKIREEIQGLKSRHGEIEGDQVCELCDQAILSRVFYLFPCSHAFHADCLLREMNKHLSAAEKAKIKELQEKLRPLSQSGLSQNDQELRDKLQAELDNIIAAECPLCGSVMIQSINKPFISKEEEAEASLWSI